MIAAIKKQIWLMTGIGIFVGALLVPSLCTAVVLPALDTVTAEDGSVWERVSEPGFGTRNNLAVTAQVPFQERIWAVTRNDVSGFELWRTTSSGWEQLTVPGFTDSVYHGLMNNIWGDMIVFQDHLYVAVASGFQGDHLYRTVGCEIWRTDGTTWEAVISDNLDTDEAGTISGISGCSAEDGETTAEITDGSKAWTPDQWAGGTLRIVSGAGLGRTFDIVSNTATILVIQQNEAANTKDVAGVETEYTQCDGFVPDSVHPKLSVGTVAAGDGFEIGMGTDENGFGEVWNKSVVDFEVHNNTLYASVGLNYEAGARIMKSADGLTWEADSDYSFGMRHGYDPDGNANDFCLINGLEDRNGSPLSSSLNNFGLSDVDGTETLYIGGTGTSGCNGRGARMYKLVDGVWTAVVDYFVDDNDEGTNDNGFGDADSFFDSNFQAWTFAEYDGRLFTGIVRIKGARVMYTDSGSAEDGAWRYSVGPDAPTPDAFDGVSDFAGYGANIGVVVYNHDDFLYAGTILNNKSPSILPPVLDGADLWRASGPADNLLWTRVTGDGFGDATVMTLESFTEFDGTLYVSASSTTARNFADSHEEGYPGAVIYRLKSIPSGISIGSYTATAGKRSVTLNWTADNETACSGYNVYRSVSEKRNKPYTVMTKETQASGSGTYAFTDKGLCPRRSYAYKLECVLTDGTSRWYGPVTVTPLKILGSGK